MAGDIRSSIKELKKSMEGDALYVSPDLLTFDFGDVDPSNGAQHSMSEVKGFVRQWFRYPKMFMITTPNYRGNCNWNFEDGMIRGYAVSDEGNDELVAEFAEDEICQAMMSAVLTGDPGNVFVAMGDVFKDMNEQVKMQSLVRGGSSMNRAVR